MGGKGAEWNLQGFVLLVVYSILALHTFGLVKRMYGCSCGYIFVVFWKILKDMGVLGLPDEINLSDQFINVRKILE